MRAFAIDPFEEAVQTLFGSFDGDALKSVLAFQLQLEQLNQALRIELEQLVNQRIRFQ
jgi:hypothetical protein